MSNLDELYQEIIIDHSENPANQGKLKCASHHAQGHNPLCGDNIEIFLNIDNEGVIQDAKFSGAGCAISVASASMMTEAIIGKNVKEVKEIFSSFHDLVSGVGDGDNLVDDLENLQVLAGVRNFPIRVKCATLAWHALNNAIDSENNS